VITRQHLLFDLDALLDTRLGCLIHHRTKESADIDMDAYRGRLADNLWTLCDNVTEEDYRSWWAQRDVAVLKCSLASSMMVRLKAMTYNLMAVRAKQGFMTDLKVVINAYPYKLDAETRQAYKESIKELVAKDFEVDVVYLPPEVLTPQVLFSSYDYYALYELDRWLTVNHVALTDHPIPAFPINAPSLYCNQIPTQADIEELGLSHREEAFAQWEVYMSAHLMLGFLPISEYTQLL
jgi:hypothetical protein